MTPTLNFDASSSQFLFPIYFSNCRKSGRYTFKRLLIFKFEMSAEMSEILLFEILNHILCNFFLIVKNVFLRFFLFFCHVSIYIANTRQLQLHVTGSIASLVALVLRQNMQTSVIFSIIAITRYATNKYGRALSSSMSLCWKLREKSSSYVGPPQYLLFYSLFIKALYMGRSTTNRRGWKPHVFFSFKYVMDGYKKNHP